MTIEYQVQRNCHLVQVGHFLHEQSFGIAMPLNSPYRSILSQVILHLRDTGKLMQLKHHWWNATISTYSNVTCSSGTFTSLVRYVDDLGSFFYICAFSILFICAIVIAECLCRRSKRNKLNIQSQVSKTSFSLMCRVN